MPISLYTAEMLDEDLCQGRPLTVIDTRAPKSFEECHIPSAIRLSWEDFCQNIKRATKEILTSPGYWGTLADPVDNQFAERLAMAGVRINSHIVVYSDGRVSKGTEGRVAWMLAFLGATDVALLNGGFPAWIERGLRVECGPGYQPVQGNFELKLDWRRRCLTADLVRQMAEGENLFLIDTRSVAEHDGTLFWYQPRTGRIPGSRLLPFSRVFQEDGKYFVQAQDYVKLLPDNPSDETMVTYCEVGVRAATVALLNEIYTGQIARVYDGSMMEWALDNKLPVGRGDNQANGSAIWQSSQLGRV